VWAGREEAGYSGTRSGHFEFVEEEGEGGIVRSVVHRREDSVGILNCKVFSDNGVHTKGRGETKTELEMMVCKTGTIG